MWTRLLTATLGFMLTATLLFAFIPAGVNIAIAVDEVKPPYYIYTLDSGDTILVGDSSTTDFKPYLELNRWGEECSIKIGLQTNEKLQPTIEGTQILWESTKEICEFFPIQDGFKFNVILKEKPLINIFPLDFDSDNLKFYYQPPLTQEFTSGWSEEFQCIISVTETTVTNTKTGDILVHRPEKVVGSYAVYHATKGNMHASQADADKYKAGKAFQWYRPLIYDAMGKECWGELNVDPKVGIRTVTIPQSFLDNAVYPVTIDDEFGYHPVSGGTATGVNYCYANVYAASLYAASSGDTITSFSLYGSSPESDGTYDVAAYSVTAGVPDSRLAAGVTITLTSDYPAASWENSGSVSQEMADGVTYCLAYGNRTNSGYVYYDAGDATDTSKDATTGAPLPATWTHDSYIDRKYAFYCTYTTAGVVAPTVVTNAATSVEETTATLSGNITATGGANATARRFQWGTNTGVYTANWTEFGNYGVGNFTHGISGLTKGEGYYYVASANNSAGWGTGSEVFFITKPDPASSFTSTDNGTTQINLGWANGTGMDYVEVRYAEGSAPSDNVSGTLGYWGSGTSANVTGLSPGTTYFFIIFTHATENSQWSTADNNPTCQDTTDSAVAPTVVTNVATSVEETTATLSGNITDTGSANATARRFQWGTNTGVYTDNWTEFGNYGVGNFTHGITGLDKGEGYYYVASANNSAGWGTGSEVFFITKPDPATSFVTTDNGTTWISLSWVNGAGEDYTEVRYSTGSVPSDNTSGILGSWASGATSANVSGLSPNTTYYFIIFTHATENSQWSTSDNSPSCQDITDTGIPTVTTNAASLVEETTARLNGEITNTGGENATAWRFQWGTNTGVYTDNYTSAGDYGVGAFLHNLTLLTEGEGYFYVASANNSAGWGYGSEVFFITKPTPATNFTSTDNGTTQINLSWSNGAGMDYVEIRYDTGSAPSDNVSGSLGYWGSGTSANVTGLNSGTTYFFIIFTHATENSQWSTADNNPTCQDTTDSVPPPPGDPRDPDLVYLEFRPDLDETRIRGNAGIPTNVLVGTFFGYSLPMWAGDNKEELYFLMCVPDRWNGSSDILVRAKTATSDNQSGNVYELELGWDKVTPNVVEAIPTGAPNIATANRTVDSGLTYACYTDWFTLDYDIEGADPIEVDDTIALRFRRFGNADNLTSELIVFEFSVLFARGDLLGDPTGNVTAIINDLIEEEILIGGELVVLLALVFLALGLTIAMFGTRNMMLGFPSLIMWAILGGYAYTQSTTTWGDWQFFLFFASAFGMTTFCALAMYGLRERRDTIADEELERGEGDYIDEGKAEEIEDGETEPSRRTKALRERAEQRRTGERKRPKRFKW